MAIKKTSDSQPKTARKSQQKSSRENNLLQTTVTPGEATNNEENIRPHTLADYIGQKDLKEVLKIAIAAAKVRKVPMDHLLLYGPPGLGKTTMSLILAAEMGVNCKITAAPALERPRDITGILINLKPGDILFIDEIHRLNRLTEELLYSAMEDFRLDITIGKGQSARIRKIPLPAFTMVGATTKVGSLTSPLRDRFGLIQRLRFYEPDELTLIVLRTAALIKVQIEDSAAREIALRARGTPRIANRLLRRVRDYAIVNKVDIITPELANKAMEMFGVDSLGLDWTDRLILQTIINQFRGGPVGLETLAAATGEDAKTIEEVYEPYLLQIGFIDRTSRGRVVPKAAYAHLGCG